MRSSRDRTSLQSDLTPGCKGHQRNTSHQKKVELGLKTTIRDVKYCTSTSPLSSFSDGHGCTRMSHDMYQSMNRSSVTVLVVRAVVYGYSIQFLRKLGLSIQNTRIMSSSGYSLLPCFLSYMLSFMGSCLLHSLGPASQLLQYRSRSPIAAVCQLCTHLQRQSMSSVIAAGNDHVHNPKL